MSKKDLGKQKSQNKQAQIYLSPVVKKGHNDLEAGILNLRDLSPYQLIYQSRDTRSHFNFSNTELSIIDTSADTGPKNLYLQSICEAYSNLIVGIINFDQNRQEQQQYEQDEYEYTQLSYQSGEKQQNLSSQILQRTNNNQKLQNKRNIFNQIEQQKSKEINKISNNPKKITCKCKKTKCLKLYCDCFRINQTCDGCNCIGCHNLQIYNEQRKSAMLSLIDRNPGAFKPKIEQQYHAKGCNCKKSNCLKKYCQCYQTGLKCGDICKCQQCKNNVTLTYNRYQHQYCNQVSKHTKYVEKVEFVPSNNRQRIGLTTKKPIKMEQWNIHN